MRPGGPVLRMWVLGAASLFPNGPRELCTGRGNTVTTSVDIFNQTCLLWHSLMATRTICIRRSAGVLLTKSTSNWRRGSGTTVTCAASTALFPALFPLIRLYILSTLAWIVSTRQYRGIPNPRYRSKFPSNDTLLGGSRLNELGRRHLCANSNTICCFNVHLGLRTQYF